MNSYMYSTLVGNNNVNTVIFQFHVICSITKLFINVVPGNKLRYLKYTFTRICYVQVQ